MHEVCVTDVSVTCAQKSAVAMGANVLKFVEEVLIFEFSKQAIFHGNYYYFWIKKEASLGNLY